jgi:hypothetical protein
MSAIAHGHPLPAFQIRARGGALADQRAARYLSLRPTGDGWALMSPGGRVVFSALGVSGRRRCLEFARKAGALAVLS